VTIIATGPLTNVADLLISYPELKKKIGQISIMGGGITHGNWRPAAEYNIFEDPEAAWTVFHAGLPLRMCGLDVTEKALIKPSEFPRLLAVGNQVAEIVTGWLEFFYRFPMQLGYSGAPVHDPCAVLSITHPEIFRIERYYVDIGLEGEYTRGATVADFKGVLGKETNAACSVEQVIDGNVVLANKAESRLLVQFKSDRFSLGSETALYLCHYSYRRIILDSTDKKNTSRRSGDIYRAQAPVRRFHSHCLVEMPDQDNSRVIPLCNVCNMLHNRSYLVRPVHIYIRTDVRLQRIKYHQSCLSAEYRLF
jgi:hypothetical protein